jgi:hypothetical protein
MGNQWLNQIYSSGRSFIARATLDSSTLRVSRPILLAVSMTDTNDTECWSTLANRMVDVIVYGTMTLPTQRSPSTYLSSLISD